MDFLHCLKMNKNPPYLYYHARVFVRPVYETICENELFFNSDMLANVSNEGIQGLFYQTDELFVFEGQVFSGSIFPLCGIIQ